MQTAGKALLAELDARKKARADALKAQINEVMSRASDILAKAQKTQDLDGLLDDLQKVHSSSISYDPEAQAQMNRVNSAYQFVAQWLDYLSARDSGNIQAAQDTLRNLSNSNRQGDAALVPRSEILARLVALTQTKPSPAAPEKPPAPDPESIISGIKTLDEMEPALKSLRVLSANNNPTPDTQVLENLIAPYSNANNGMPVTLSPGNQNFYNGNPDPDMDRVKAMLMLYLLPRYIGSGAPATNPGESVNDYLNRAIATTAAKQDWISLQRVIEAEKNMANGQNQTPGTMAVRSFFAGLNQEAAGQYSQAVTSYQSALRDPDDAVPAKVIGDRLAAIKKDHPADYDEGMKPSTAPFYNPALLRAMMGYPVPGMGIQPGAQMRPPGTVFPTPSLAPATNATPAPAAPTVPAK